MLSAASAFQSESFHDDRAMLPLLPQSRMKRKDTKA
jgi:hypothetical protein